MLDSRSPRRLVCARVGGRSWPRLPRASAGGMTSGAGAHANKGIPRAEATTTSHDLERARMMLDWARRNPRPARCGLVLVCCLVGGAAARVRMALAAIDPTSTLGLAAPPVAIGAGVVVRDLDFPPARSTPF